MVKAAQKEIICGGITGANVLHATERKMLSLQDDGFVKVHIIYSPVRQKKWEAFAPPF